VYFDDFTDERARDLGILRLAEKVETFVDAECDRVFPREFPAVLRVHLWNGRAYEERVMHNRGGPGRPLTDAELWEKFRLNAEHALSADEAKALGQAAMALDTSAEVETLMRCARPG
jgi:2-methylcitrate dehydratase PrpD